MAKILFLTDSAADIPKSLREELGIRVMPFPIAMGERELRDGEDFTPQEFYQALAEEPKIPTHAQLTTYQFQQCYEETWKAGYTDLIYTSINSEGSATYQNAVHKARIDLFIHVKGRIHRYISLGFTYVLYIPFAHIIGDH